MSEYRYLRAHMFGDPITWRVNKLTGHVQVWSKDKRTKTARKAGREYWAESGYSSEEHINRNIKPGSAGFATEISEEEL